MRKDELLTTGETARILDRAANTVRWYADMGLLKARRTARGTRIFMRKDVEAFAVQRQASKKKLMKSKG